MPMDHPRRIKRLLVANRGEIAIRICRAATELGMTTIALYSQEDRFALHRFKADESYLVGQGLSPTGAYLSIEEVMRVAREAKADAIHPGYGFLSENPDLAEACRAAGITFVGPSPETMRMLGSKVSARTLAEKAGVPVVPATPALPDDPTEIARLAEGIGFPVMVKASWGGGGRGMRPIDTPAELIEKVTAARREAKAAFGSDEVYLEKLVRHARHVEVQILGDAHGALIHLFERDCSIQRRNQKVIERAPAPYADAALRTALCEAALKVARAADYVNAGTVEFLLDAKTNQFFFIEVNPRIQVEHTVTETVTGVDLVKAQLRVAEGARVGSPESGIPAQADLRLNGHAIQCRITTEDPENNFIPDYGRITAYRGATGFGIRLDGGTAFSGALVTRFYDSLLEKITAWAPTPDEAVARMDRALREFRIRGVATNLLFLEAVLDHPRFRDNSYTTRFIEDHPELLKTPPRRDRATRLLTFIGDVTVNGNPEVKGRPRPVELRTPRLPPLPMVPDSLPAHGSRAILQERGAAGLAAWMREQKRLLITDTTMRDAHQSLLATRMRSHDLVTAAPAYAHLLPGLFSLECWGGATFDVALRFLKEDPFARLRALRAAMPGHLLQMLLRASNGVGYTSYPDNVVRHFVFQAAEAGMDIFRVFDSLNWVENMRVAMDAVIESGAVCEAAICYTGDIDNPRRDKYTLDYYVTMAKDLEKAGAHVLGIKDMAGLCKPNAIRRLIGALRQEVSLPIHFHTHDTSGFAGASLYAAAEAGVDAVDAALDSFSGSTSQPCLGSLVAALRFGERDSGLDPDAIRALSDYWEEVRSQYAAFEAGITPPASEVYVHEMPGGQYTNLREQARALGLADRWPDVATAYAQVNTLFGDIVKVTPTSKVVGDMALVMVTNGLTPEDVLNPEKDIAFPDSVVSFFKGELGQPHGGFPPALQAKVLKGAVPPTDRPGALMPAADLAAKRAEAERAVGRALSEDEFAAWLMYPKVFQDYAAHRRTYGDVSTLPTPVYFYGMETGQEIAVDLERGKTLFIRFLAVGESGEDGRRTVFFELNGQPRTVKVLDRALAPARPPREKADSTNPGHVAAPMPGVVSVLSVSVGQTVRRGDVLLAIEAMKMETSVTAEMDGTVTRILVPAATQVEAKDLLMEIAP